MKDFIREYPLFSLCGLNCGLCTMHLGGYCPGCGGGEGNQSCSIARCGKERGVEFCSSCVDYPCKQYDSIDAYDSFISTQNMRGNLEKLRNVGLAACKTELDEKIAMLAVLLKYYNDGRHKSPFCTAVNLLEIERLRILMKVLGQNTTDEMTMKEKAALASKLMQAAAEEQGISLKLRKKK